MEVLSFLFFGSVAFDARGQRAISVFAVDDPFRKVVRRVLEDRFLTVEFYQFEVCAGCPGFRMRHVKNFGAARFDAQIFKEYGLPPATVRLMPINELPATFVQCSSICMRPGAVSQSPLSHAKSSILKVFTGLSD